MTIYGYDGVDIDWEFPSSSDKANFTAFMNELYTAVKALPNDYFGTKRIVTFYTTTGYYDAGVDWGVIHNYCDYAIQSGYGWETYNAPLYNTQNLWTEAGYNIQASMSGFGQSIESRGFPAGKWILGLPFFSLRGWTQDRYGDVTTSGTYQSYDDTRKLAIYSYLGNTVYVNNTQAFTDDISYVKTRSRPGIAIWDISQIYPKTDLWTTIKTESCAGVTPLPTSTSTATPDPSGSQILDDFEDGEMTVNNRMGAWSSWSATGSSVTNTITTDSAMGTYAGRMSGDVIGNNWPSISVATDLNQTGTEEDLSTFSGLNLYMKGNAGSGTGVSFLIMLVSTNIPDSSYWRYQWTPSANWTQVNIP